MKRYFSIIFIFFFLVAGTNDDGSPEIFLASGKKFAKVSGQTNRPKIVIDTVRFVGSAYASLSLNAHFSRGVHTVSASSNNNMFINVTQILEDSTKTPNDYAAMPIDNGRRIIIKSSSATDSSKVSVLIILN